MDLDDHAHIARKDSTAQSGIEGRLEHGQELLALAYRHEQKGRNSVLATRSKEAEQEDEGDPLHGEAPHKPRRDLHDSPDTLSLGGGDRSQNNLRSIPGSVVAHDPRGEGEPHKPLDPPRHYGPGHHHTAGSILERSPEFPLEPPHGPHDPRAGSAGSGHDAPGSYQREINVAGDARRDSPGHDHNGGNRNARQQVKDPHRPRGHGGPKHGGGHRKARDNVDLAPLVKASRGQLDLNGADSLFSARREELQAKVRSVFGYLAGRDAGDDNGGPPGNGPIDAGHKHKPLQAVRDSVDLSGRDLFEEPPKDPHLPPDHPPRNSGRALQISPRGRDHVDLAFLKKVSRGGPPNDRPLPHQGTPHSPIVPIWRPPASMKVRDHVDLALLEKVSLRDTPKDPVNPIKGPPKHPPKHPPKTL